MAHAGFVCDKAPVIAAVLRKKIKDRLFMSNTENILYHQTKHCVADDIISHYAACSSDNVICRMVSRLVIKILSLIPCFTCVIYFMVISRLA